MRRSSLKVEAKGKGEGAAVSEDKEFFEAEFVEVAMVELEGFLHSCKLPPSSALSLSTLRSSHRCSHGLRVDEAAQESHQ